MPHYSPELLISTKRLCSFQVKRVSTFFAFLARGDSETSSLSHMPCSPYPYPELKPGTPSYILSTRRELNASSIMKQSGSIESNARIPLRLPQPRQEVYLPHNSSIIPRFGDAFTYSIPSIWQRKQT